MKRQAWLGGLAACVMLVGACGGSDTIPPPSVAEGYYSPTASIECLEGRDGAGGGQSSLIGPLIRIEPEKIEAHAHWAELVGGLGIDEKTLYLIIVDLAPPYTTDHVAIGFTGTDDDARRAEAEIEKRWFDLQAALSSKDIASQYKEEAAAHRHNAIYFTDENGSLNRPLRREIESCLRRGSATG